MLLDNLKFQEYTKDSRENHKVHNDIKSAITRCPI